MVVGQSIAVGDEILTLESMKMEIPVLAEHAGVIADLFVEAGDAVDEGGVLAHVA